MVDGQRNGKNGDRNHSRGRTQAEPGLLADMQRQLAALTRQMDEARAREGSQASNAPSGNSSGSRAPSASSTRRGGNSSDSSRSGSGFGHGGNRSRQPSAASSRGSRGGISRNRQNPRPVRNFIAQVPEAERLEAINEHGASRMVVVNTSLTGSDNNRFVAPTYTGGAIGRTPNMQDISAVANRVKQSNGVSHVSFQVEPDFNDMHEFKQNKRVTERVTASNGRVRPGRSANSGLTADTRISLVSELRGKHCDICMSKTHCLAQCIFAPRGYIVGCPMCNSRTHQIDHCGEYKKLTMEEKVKLLISDRASLPPLLTDETWDDLLWNYLQREDSVVPAGYPWTEPFSREESCRDSCRTYIRVQEAYDKDGDKGTLPFDEATGSLKAINKTYWQHNKTNRPWTDRLDQLALIKVEEVLPSAESAAFNRLCLDAVKEDKIKYE